MTQTVINFEDVNAPGALANIQQLVQGWGTQAYYGLQWDNFFTLDAARRPGSGYQNVVTSGESVGYNGLENPASFASTTGDFALKQGYFAAAWNIGLNVTAIAFDDGVEVGRQTFTLDLAKKLITFGAGFTSIDKVVFMASGGRDASARDRGEGTQIAIDDLMLTGERQVATFDGLTRNNGTAEVKDGHRGVNWDGIWSADDGYAPGFGLSNAMRSGQNAGYTAAGATGSISSAGRDFDFMSGWFAATGTGPMSVTAQGFDNGVLVAEKVFTVGSTKSLVTFAGFESVDDVKFQTGGRSLSMDDVLFVLDPPGVGYVSDLWHA